MVGLLCSLASLHGSGQMKTLQNWKHYHWHCPHQWFNDSDLCTAWGDIVTRDTPSNISPMLVGSPLWWHYDDYDHICRQIHNNFGDQPHTFHAMLSGVTAQVEIILCGDRYGNYIFQCSMQSISLKKVFYGLYLFSKTISTFYALAWDLKYWQSSCSLQFWQLSILNPLISPCW